MNDIEVGIPAPHLRTLANDMRILIAAVAREHKITYIECTGLLQMLTLEYQLKSFAILDEKYPAQEESDE